MVWGVHEIQHMGRRAHHLGPRKLKVRDVFPPGRGRVDHDARRLELARHADTPPVAPGQLFGNLSPSRYHDA